MNNFHEVYWGVNKMKTVNVCYKWTIYNYSNHKKAKDECITAPSFKTNDGSEWRFEIYPEKPDSKVTIYLRSMARARDKLHVLHELCVLNSKEEEAMKLSGTQRFTTENTLSGGLSIGKDFLSDQVNDLLPEDKLTILCKMTVSSEDQTYSSQSSVGDENSQSQITIHDQLASLWEDDRMTDVTLCTIDKEFTAHKVILAARSPVFLAMFTNKMKEQKTDRVEMLDCSGNVVKDMLEFMYTGRVKNLEKNSFELLKMADKYVIDELKTTCENLIYKKLSINNAIEVLILADQYNSSRLKKKAIMFIIAHKNDVTKLSDFDDLQNSHAHLLIDILSRS